MGIDFTRVLKNMEGEEITDSATQKPFTLALCATNALVSAGLQDQFLSGDENLQRFLLAEKICGLDKTNVELTAEEIALIKDRIAKMYKAPLVAGQALKMLDAAHAAKVKGPKAA